MVDNRAPRPRSNLIVAVVDAHAPRRLINFAVNSGIGTAVRCLQRALGVADDGNWGRVSQQAADLASETEMIMRLNAERLDFMTRLRNWPHHGKGWARRIAQNLRYGAEDS